MNASRDEIRQRAAAEVIELGEMLFDTAIDAAEGEASDASLIEEMRATANEFFTAMRLLLEIGQDTGKPKQ